MLAQNVFGKNYHRLFNELNVGQDRFGLNLIVPFDSVGGPLRNILTKCLRSLALAPEWIECFKF